MDVRYQSGFTVIETMLFLAISALLLTAIFIGTGTSLYAVRFTDSSRSMQSFLQKQYDDILNGFNPRSTQDACSGGVVNPNPSTSDPVGASNCLLLGKLILLKKNASVLTAYDIVGTEPANPNYNQSDAALIYDYQPSVVTNADVQTYQVPWQAFISGSKRQADTSSVDAFALIRSPRSTNILSYTYAEPAGAYSLASLINPATPADADNFASATNTTNFCLESNDALNSASKVTITGGQGQDAIQLSFTVNVGDCN